jgi:hypothetical protein
MTPGYLTPVRFSYATLATLLSNVTGATTKKTANTVYQVTTKANRFIDPTSPVVVNVDADGAGGGTSNVAASTAYAIDYLTGTVTFGADQGAPTTVDLAGTKALTAFLNAPEVTEARVSVSADMLPATNKSHTDGYKRVLAGQKDAEIEVDIQSLPQTDLDGGGGVLSFVSALVAGTPLFVEVDLDESGDRMFCGWFTPQGITDKTDPKSLYGATVKLVAAPIVGNGRNDKAVFGFVDRNL